MILKKAFSLVELLVVIAIIATLVSITIPLTNIALAKAKGLECQNNLGEWSKAFSMYIDDNRLHMIPPDGDGSVGTDESKLAWYNVLPAILDIDNLDAIRSAGGRLPAPGTGTKKNLYVCPTAARGSSNGMRPYFSYAYNRYLNAEGRLRASTVRDTSSLIVFFDSPDGDTFLADNTVTDKTSAFRHNNRINVAFFDGSVRTLRKTDILPGDGGAKAPNFKNVLWDPWAAE